MEGQTTVISTDDISGYQPSKIARTSAPSPSPFLMFQPHAHRRDDTTTWADVASRRPWSSVEAFESPPMKSAPFLLSFALLWTLGACSKQPQEVAPPLSSAAPASAFATPASDPSLPSASVAASAPPTPVDAPASAPAGMPMASSGPAAASAARAP